MKKGYIKLGDEYLNKDHRLDKISEAYVFTEDEFLSKNWLRMGFIFEPLEENTSSKTPFKEITDSIADLLSYKNKKYGESALDPINIFNGKSKVGQRLDDKISRVKNNPVLQKNDIADIIGYLVLVCKENNWNDFSEFKD